MSRSIASQELLTRSMNGLELLRQSSFDAAIQEFRYAIKVVAATVISGVENAPEFASIRITVYDVDEDQEHQQCKAFSSFSDHNTMYIHSSAFRLCEGANGHCLRNDCIASSLLYNVGLAHHLKAHQTHGKAFNFRRALKSYEVAGQILLRRGQMNELDAGDRTLLLAIYNNKAHASYNFFDYATSSNCLEVLRYILSQTTQDDAEHCRKFNLNLLFADGQCKRSAPAA
mmetsp:Transcript_3760/g.4993  ORF Transcript_3760/g.4993 Transcript_3760/m.4993 type:complete len:229 (-) Transcript_3760:41-727(-)